MSAILDSLNPRQQQAVCHNNGGLLVLAGAGTGKTRVLTSRIAWLMSENHCSARDILAVTFTNKAAKEMRQRVAAMMAFAASSLTLGTFHGICHRMLRRHADAAGWDKNFQILDSQDQKSFIRRLLAEADIDREEFPPGDCRNYINRAKENGLRAAAAPADSPRARAMREIYALYEKFSRREHKLDFAELLLSALELLSTHDDLRQHYAARFRHILIDEFQDTNPLQYRWLKLLDGGDNDFFAVGDDDQSIYAFRGADPRNMQLLQHELRVREIIRLEHNYRSTGNILSAANTLIAVNKNRLGKNLITDSDAGAKIVIARAAGDLTEANDIARKIKNKIAANAEADEIAVLYRTNAQSRLLERALLEHGMPYRIYGGLRFFERQEIKHALAYLRLAITDDNDAVLRVINMPPRGIGAKTLAVLTAGNDIMAAVRAGNTAKTAAFGALVGNLRRLRENNADLPTITRAAVEDSGLLAYYEARPQEIERAENLRELVNAASQYKRDDDSEEEEPLLQFLANAALESGEAQNTATATAIKGAISLMTVHAAKGLEFSTVFVAGLEEGMFPYSLSLDSPDPAALEEERRLMYVAVTRARRELFLHFADSRMLYGQQKIRPPSRFLHELPASSIAADITPPRRPTPAAPPRLPPPPLPASMPEVPGLLYRPGDTVRHARYGQGVVIRREGSGEKLKVEVTFKKIGSKTFLAAAAPLEKI